MGTLIKGTFIAGLTLLLAGTVDQGSAPQRELAPLASQERVAQRPPERPRVTVEVPELTRPARTVHVAAQGSLQEALDSAQPGDVITLEPRATYRGPFRLRQKNGDGWIVITSASARLPEPGRHVEPADASLMPRLVTAEDPVFVAERGAHHYRFVGLEIAPVAGTFVNTLVQLGDGEKNADEVPHHFIFDRCFVHGDALRGARRGIAMNGAHIAVVDSYLSDFKEVGADSQAIGGWNGPGPFRIAGNYLEGAGENVMFGGADPTIPGLVPSDIEIVRNHIAKPLRWKAGHSSFEGTEWTVKNLFELKNARRVLVDGNLFEYNWRQAQNGFGILFTVRNQEGASPWSQVEDVTFSNNVVRHVGAGINILGEDDNHPSQPTRRIAVQNNIFLDVGGQWGDGRLFQLLDGAAGVTIEHNTALHTGSILFAGDHDPHPGFVFQNNIVLHNENGIVGSGTGAGTATLRRYFPDAIVRGNVLVGADAGAYPRGNFFPSSIDDLGARIVREGEFRLTLARPYARGGFEGRDPGADAAAIARAMGGIAAIGLGTSANAQRPTGQLPMRPLLGGLSLSEIDVDLLIVDGVGAGSLDVGGFLHFLVPLLLLAYVYAGYPVVAIIRAMIRPCVRVRAPIEPTVSIIVVGYNEAERIEARIENLLDLDYPRDRLQIVVASDGSTDDTVRRALRYRARGVTVIPFTQRRGKTAVVNAVVPSLRGEIVLFADARQRFERSTLRALVQNFADPAIGAVSGELVLSKDGTTAAAAQGAAVYWRYEKVIRSSEGRADSTVGATGAIYAIRRVLFQLIPNDTILDDVLIPLRIVKQGYRVVFEPTARAYDAMSTTARQEFARKARTIAGNFQLFAREPWLLNPWRNRLWFETISHKGLRLTLPLLHLWLLAATLALPDGWLFRGALAAQIVFYAAALVGSTQRGARRHSSIVLSVPSAICLLSWATVVGFVRFVTNRQHVTWDRVAPTSVRHV